ncbi:MAG: efflux RND transporter permease subunit [Deltaproteobacteria bacterium]|nr:efflux RND transporter permease subunit [Deltaproteobacteria bacterium]
MTSSTENKRIKGPVFWMVKHPVPANLLMVLFLVGGLCFGMNMKQELFPSFDMDRVIVTVPYPGAGPAEVEQGIVLAVEEAVQGLDDIDEITSSAREGSGMVEIDMLAGGDLKKLAQDVKSAVDRILTFPVEAEEPRVSTISHHRRVISLVLYGDQDERVLREMIEKIRDRLLQDPLITQVELFGVRPLEISVEVSQDILRTYKLTLGEIARRLRKASVELPGGRIKTDSGELLVRMMERRDYGREFAAIPVITNNNGTEVLLEDISTVIDGFMDVDKYATYNGKRAVMINVFRVGDQTPVEVAEVVHKLTAELQATLPPGLEVATLNDFSRIYRQRLELLQKNGCMGLILVLILLGIFLDPRLAFWVTMGIPISFFGSLIFLPGLGMSINMVSLFAFIIALGIVVDDAIVVGESIYKFHEKGLPFIRAAVQGTREVALPVIFSIMTNIIAFLPICFVPGNIGKFFRVIPIVVITIFVISLIESLFILPAHIGHQRKNRHGRIINFILNRQRRFSNRLARLIENRYGPFLEGALKYRYMTLATGIMILAITLSYVMSGRMGMTMFPKVEAEYAVATAVLPYGSSVKKTGAVQQKLINAAKKVIKANGDGRLAEGIYAEIGYAPGKVSGGHLTRVKIFLNPPGQRTISTNEVTQLWRKETGAIPGLESLVFQSDAGGPGSGPSITIELSHRDLKILEAASADLAEALSYFPDVTDIDDGFEPGKEQFDFKIRPEGRSLGLTAREVANQVRDSFYGAEVLRQQRGRNEIKVMVRLPENERSYHYNLEELMLRSPEGVEVPLKTAVEITRGRAYTVIDRRNGRRVITVTCNVTPQSQASRILASLKEDFLPALVNRYQGLNYGFEGRQADMAESMTTLWMGLGAAMMVMYALLAVLFNSYIQPLIIMMSIPSGIVGAVIGHIIMGYSLSVMSMFGIVALSGVVVNDSLILIDFANRSRKQGITPHKAIHSAGIYRFRPIVLTTLSTFFGLSPMIFETSRQARFLIPMAISLGFGILFATFITLVLVPSLYLIVEDLRGNIRGDKGHS